MRITVVGSGTMGRAYGAVLARAGHAITYTYARRAAALDAAARAGGPNARGVPSPREAVRGADVVLLTVRYEDVPDALAATGAADGALAGTVLAEAVTPLTPDHKGLAVGFTSSAAEEIAALAPGARVVVAGQNTFAEVLRAPARALGGETPTMFFCGDDAGAKATVASLMHDAGYEPVDGGPLANARYLEPLCCLMTQLASAGGLGPRIGLRLLREPHDAAADRAPPRPVYRAHHVGIAVADRAATVAWYAERLGFREEYSFDVPRGRVTMVERDGLRVEVMEVAGVAPFPPAERTPGGDLAVAGVKHYAWRVDDLDAAVRELAARGVEIPEPPGPGVGPRRFAFFRDNNGIAVELIEAREERAS